MFTIDFHHPIHIHFMGIGGISMSGLAEVLLQEGFSISGSDMKASDITAHLETLGAKVFIGQKASNLSKDIDLIVYTAAIHPDNEEFAAAKKAGIPMLTRAALLGQIMSNYEKSIAVSGTHGKTTTTSMLSHILLEACADPTISVGGILDRIDGNIRVGHSDVFITEACEYTNSFLELYPRYNIILNVEEDHLDFFSGIDEIIDSFHTFASQTAKDGLLIINGDMECLPLVTKDLAIPYVTVGLKPENTYTASDITFDEQGCGHYELIIKGEKSGHIDLNVNGMHNVTNSLAAIAVAKAMNLSMDAIKKGLLSFGGTKRRFEYKGTVNGITIIDDYAHHPTEIKATLTSAKNYPHRELWCIFQPHTYSRTKAFLSGFIDSLSSCDHVILADIFAAREADPGDIHSKDIVDGLLLKGCDAHYFSTFEQIEEFILKNCKENDLLITMGAGDVVLIGENLISR
ncbi:MAG: UDP-N-acetylmuramate--L-alanine ligase [Lachnospiraceae bacterium]|nr:UDP-N-acetylmuramate--L-alanine ligase [Lachnospiraceae bacterium]